MIPPMQAYDQHLNMILGDVEGDRSCKYLSLLHVSSVSSGIKLDFQVCTLVAFIECVAKFS